MKLSVTHYSGDRLGGAGRAAVRLHDALRGGTRITSDMIVAEKVSDDYTITGLDGNLQGRINALIKPVLDSIPRRLAGLPDAMPRSAAWASRLTAKQINSQTSRVTHLHWINGAFLSVEEIGKITKPLVWTFHDMWPFCGAEHLSPDTADARWRLGYPASQGVRGFDLDRWVWKRKQSSFRNIIHVVTPSRWLAECVEQSKLMSSFPIHVIPNPLDTNVFKPVEKLAARRLLNLPLDRKLVLFGAIKGTQLPYKGWDLLLPALARVAEICPGADAVIFGQKQPKDALSLQLPIHWMGHLYDDFTLAALYSAADVLVIPSRQESFGQTGSEAQACGCPVVAFDATGLRDVVGHQQTGLLVKPFEPHAFSDAIVAVLENDEMRHEYGIAARDRAQRLWSYPVVAEQYSKLYESITLPFPDRV